MRSAYALRNAIKQHPMSNLSRLGTFLLLFSGLNCEAAENVSGRWEGSIQIPSREFPLVVDLDQTAGNNWTGSLIIPGLGVKGAPLTDLSVGDAAISFTIKGALANERVGQAKFQGNVTSAGELAGEFLQAGNSAPFRLRKTGPPQVEVPRKSTAISAGLEGEWKGDYQMDGYPRHVRLRLTNQKPGCASAELVIVGKRTNNAPVELVSEANGFLTIESPQLGITYEGRLRKETGALDGTFTLGPFELPLVLRRASAKAP
jgi:hypothetical protein